MFGVGEFFTLTHLIICKIL